MIDLRSDTVTLPTDAMRAAMAAAPLGDDQFGEDPSVNLLQERVAALLGKEAGLFVPDGDDGQPAPAQALLPAGRRRRRRRGEPRRLARDRRGRGQRRRAVHRRPARGGLYTADELRAVMKPRGHLLFPPTTLVEVEDTHNRMGGLVWDRAELEAVAAAAREHGAASYLDGARLLNAAAARGDDPPRSPRRSTSSRSRSRRASAAPAAPCSPARARTSRALTATGGCSAARCARPACSPPRACTRSSTTSSACPRTTRNARAIGERLAAVDGVALDLDAARDEHRRLPARRGPARRRHRRRPREGARRARDGLRARGRSAPSPTSTSPPRTAPARGRTCSPDVRRQRVSARRRRGGARRARCRPAGRRRRRRG